MNFFVDPVVVSGGEAVMALIMISSNSFLVFVTLKAKNLNSTCNLLIAANSACIVLYSFTYFVQFGIALFSPVGIPLWQCCLLISGPLFFLCCQNVLFPLIALDRLIGTIVPLKQIGIMYKRRYMLFALTSAISFGTFMVTSSVNKSIINFSENLVLCMTPDPAPAFFAGCAWVLNISSAVLYLALLVRVQLMPPTTSAGVSRKVLFSLLLIALVEAFGWVSNWTVRLLVTKLGATQTTKWQVLSYCALILQLSLSLNAPILFIRNREYRNALTSVFRSSSSAAAERNFVRIIRLKNGNKVFKISG